MIKRIIQTHNLKINSVKRKFSAPLISTSTLTLCFLRSVYFPTLSAASSHTGSHISKKDVLVAPSRSICVRACQLISSYGIWEFHVIHVMTTCFLFFIFAIQLNHNFFGGTNSQCKYYSLVSQVALWFASFSLQYFIFPQFLFVSFSMVFFSSDLKDHKSNNNLPKYPNASDFP